MDPSPFGPPGAQCKMTRDELQRLLEQSGYGASNPAMFQVYFIQGMGGGPPLCCACMQPVGAHSSTTGVGGGKMVMAGQPAGFGGPDANLLAQSGFNPKLPACTVRSSDADTFSSGSHTDVVITVVVLGIAGLLCLTGSYIPPIIVGIVGALLLFSNGPVEVIFDRRET